MANETVIQNKPAASAAMAPAAHPTRFPCIRRDPKTGEAKVCNSPADVPAGWLAYHPNDKAKVQAAAIAGAAKLAADVAAKAVVRKAAAPAPAAPPDKRTEIEAELTRRKIAFDPKMTVDQLYEVLLKAVEKEV